MNVKNLRARSLVTAVVATWALTAPLGASADVLSDLYDAAKTEGVVTTDGPWTAQQMQGVIEAFSQKYPGIEVRYTNQTGPQTVNQLMVESSAGNVSIDAPGIYVPSIQPLLDNDILEAFDGWAALGVPEDVTLLDGRYVYLHDSATVMAYNTTLLSKDETPKTWEDLLDPKWADNQIAVDSRGYFLSGLALSDKYGLERTEELAKGLLAQRPHFVQRNSAALESMSIGEVGVSSAPLSMLIGKIDVGAPVDILPISPVVVNTFGSAVAAKAQHPNAAKLWIAFLASKEGRDALDAQSIGYATPCNESKMGTILCDAGIELIYQKTLEDSAQYGDATKAVSEILSAAK